MYSCKLENFSDAALLGRVLLKWAFPCLEAFSGNALYCGRRMPPMSKYKTVKEVCALTGLTRKHLYYFHHEKVVQAAAYANYSVEDCDGYKLYDDAAVEKLQQIALYYQLGLKRNEIRDIMLDPGYDSNQILKILLVSEQGKKIHAERHIAALEYLTLAGTRNGVSGSLRGISLDELGRTLLDLREAAAENCSPPSFSQAQADLFAEELSALIFRLASLDDNALMGPDSAAVIRQIFDLGEKYMGEESIPFILGLFMSALGEGSVANEISQMLKPSHGRAVIQYIMGHPELYAQCHNSSGTESAKNNRRNEK